jgi:hypothetical protein
MPRAADLDLLIQRAIAGGLAIEAVELTPDGIVRVLTRRPHGDAFVESGEDWVALAGQPAPKP